MAGSAFVSLGQSSLLTVNHKAEWHWAYHTSNMGGGHRETGTFATDISDSLLIYITFDTLHNQLDISQMAPRSFVPL